MQLGNFQAARYNYNKVLEREPKNRSASEEIRLLDRVEDDLAQARANVTNERYSNALRLYSSVLERCENVAVARLGQAEALMGMKRYHQASKMINAVLQEDKENLYGFYLRAKSMYFAGHLESAETLLKKVLNMDPDDKNCKVLWKKIKKLLGLKKRGNDAFRTKDYQSAIELYTQAIEEDPTLDALNATLYGNRAAAHMGLEQYENAEYDCTKSLTIDENYNKVRLRRARCYMSLEKYDDAVRDYEHIARSDGEASGDMREKIREAKMLAKRAKRKDYYKILGITRHATESEIKKAYRKMARKWHPDKNNGSEDETKVAEAKFKEISAAYAILSDPDKKRKFDSGADMENESSGFQDMDVSDLMSMFMGGFGGPMRGGPRGRPRGGHGHGGPGFSFHFG